MPAHVAGPRWRRHGRWRPAAAAVAIAQDRIREKAHFVRLRRGLRAAMRSIERRAAGGVPDDLLPGILKTARLGYDGKGQQRVDDARRARTPPGRDSGGVPCVLEKLLPLAFECSVIVARGADGQIVHFPPQRNLHRDGILAVTEVHAGNHARSAGQARRRRRRMRSQKAWTTSACCASSSSCWPTARWWSTRWRRARTTAATGRMDACDISQFELQVRALAGLPLARRASTAPAIMLNLLGDLWFADSGDARVEPRWADVLALPGTHLHLYGKTEARRGRKMGHLTITGANVDAVRSTARLRRRAAGHLPIPLSDMIRDGRAPDAIDEAARTLRAGGLVAFPTETVYGLGADAASDAAVAGSSRPRAGPATIR